MYLGIFSLTTLVRAQIRFEGYMGDGSQSDIAIDDVEITPCAVPTTTLPFGCDFEYEWCSLYQGKSDIFEWKRLQGRTGTQGTGPSGDHTTGSGAYITYKHV